jgi:hypothetical protein
MNDDKGAREEAKEDAQEDLELTDGDADKVAGGKPAKADGSLDAGLHFKYDIKAQKEG